MIERREQLGLTLESIQPLSVARKFLGQHFDGHFAAELGIPSSVDFSHAARTEGVEDLVVGKGASEHRRLG